MTISTTNTKDQINGNGSATSFNYNFMILNQSDLEVIKTSSTGVDTTLSVTTDYTVANVGSDSGSIVFPAATSSYGTCSVTNNGATITNPTDCASNSGVWTVTPLATGEKLTIRRKMNFTQPTDLQNQGGFFAEVHEQVFDRQAMYAQQNDEEIARTIKLPTTETSNMTLPIKSNRLGKILGFNATTGLPELSASMTEVNSLASITSDITTVADNVTKVTSLYTNMSDINTIANNMTTLLATVYQLDTLAVSRDEDEILTVDASGNMVWESAPDQLTLNGGYF